MNSKSTHRCSEHIRSNIFSNTDDVFSLYGKKEPLYTGKQYIKNILLGEINISDEITRYNELNDTDGYKINTIYDYHNTEHISKENLYNLYRFYCQKNCKRYQAYNKFCSDIKLSMSERRISLNNGLRIRAITLPKVNVLKKKDEGSVTNESIYSNADVITLPLDISEEQNTQEYEVEKCVSEDNIKIYTYARISSSTQAHGYSLNIQKTECENWIDEHYPHIISQHYEDIGSGRDISKLPNLNSLMSKIKPNDIIVFTDVDRFSRNTHLGMIYIRSLLFQKVTLVFVRNDITLTHESTLDELEEVESLIDKAQHESNQISKRIKGYYNYNKCKKTEKFNKELESKITSIVRDMICSYYKH